MLERKCTINQENNSFKEGRERIRINQNKWYKIIMKIK